MGITRRTLLETQDIKDSVVTRGKFSETLDYGTLADVGKTGTYLHFSTAFGGTPTLVLTGVLGGLGTVAELMTTPKSGSARIRTTGSGTVVVEYMAWGPKA